MKKNYLSLSEKYSMITCTEYHKLVRYETRNYLCLFNLLASEREEEKNIYADKKKG